MTDTAFARTPGLTRRFTTRLSAALGLALLTAACSSGPLSKMNAAPPLSPVSAPSMMAAEYQPVVMPMPVATPEVKGPNALWQSGSRSFFKNQRAANVGDILTVKVVVNDRATFDNRTSTSRDSERNAGIANLGGLETKIAAIAPGGFDASKIVGLNSNNSRSGEGSVDRSETLETRVAATVVQVLPNGHLVIQGRQEVRVNHERRDLIIAGIVRPIDIESDNTVQSTKIAEARISYGGHGELSAVSRRRYGDRVLDFISPF